MREIRLYGSEGGGAEFNRLFLPLSMIWRRRVPAAFLRAEFSEEPCMLPGGTSGEKLESGGNLESDLNNCF